MTAAALIAALVSCGLISLAIRSHLARKRKCEAQRVFNSILNRNAVDAPALEPAAILSPPARGPIESEVPPGRVVEGATSSPGEPALSATEAQLDDSVDLASITSTATRIPGNTAKFESAPVTFSEPRAEAAALLLQKESPAPAINDSAGQPGVSPRAAESVAPAAAGLSASKARLTASPATTSLIVAPAVGEAEFESKENRNTEEDALPADVTVDTTPVEAAEEISNESAEVGGGGVPPTHPGHRLVNEDELQEGAAALVIALELPAMPAARGEARGYEESTPAIAQYRPPVLAPPAIKRSRATRSTPTARVSQNSLEVRLQLMISRTGDVHAGFLFKRPDDFPASLALKVRSKEVALSAYGDGWYAADLADQSFVADALAQGFIASDRVIGNLRTSWMLSAGREIYVTATQPGLGGYHFVPRLALGRTQLVLVREHLQAQAMQILVETCGKPVQRFALDQVPMPGWALLGPALPLKPLAQRPGEDTMNVLRPLPELSILLEGGLCLRGTEWLQGFPPRITVAGPIPDGECVLIDAVAASVDSQGAYEIPGYDLAGDHTIWCAGVSRSYSISRAPQSWEPWRAHDGRKGSVCGALSDYQMNNPQARLTTVPCSNKVLIGAEPGQVFAGSGHGGDWTGIVPFAPVWALPANPFQCRKNAARIMLRAPIPVTRAGASRFKSHAVKAWCRAILDCQRKGLTLESPGGAALWNDYVRAARAAWRSVR
jgi:hypothetical protein